MNLPIALQQLPRLAALLHSWVALVRRGKERFFFFFFFFFVSFPFFRVQKSDLPPAVRQGAKELFSALMRSPEWSKRWTAVQPEMQQYIEQQLK